MYLSTLVPCLLLFPPSHIPLGPLFFATYSSVSNFLGFTFCFIIVCIEGLLRKQHLSYSYMSRNPGVGTENLVVINYIEA